MQIEIWSHFAFHLNLEYEAKKLTASEDNHGCSHGIRVINNHQVFVSFWFPEKKYLYVSGAT